MPFTKNKLLTIKHQGGVILLEVLVSVLIFSIGILAVIGLQAAAIANVSDAKFRVDASSIAERKIGEMWATQATLAPGSTTDTVPELPSGSMTTTIAGSPITGWAVTIAITWTPPNATTAHKFDTVARIYAS